jgi:GrpB-like predicted nucleotidyltransferase (UPF0157 family)
MHGDLGLTPTKDEDLRKVTIGELNRHNAPITLVEHDPRWPELFGREADRIRVALGSRILLLEHVGSTSVPGLCAKPIIDMVLVVSDPSDELSYVPFLEEAGYRLRIREPDWFEHRMFKGPDSDINLHVFSEGVPEVERMLRFRDRLRANDADRDTYARTKRKLAHQAWRYVQNYADAKNAIIQEILEHANAVGNGPEPKERRP